MFNILSQIALKVKFLRNKAQHCLLPSLVDDFTCVHSKNALLTHILSALFSSTSVLFSCTPLGTKSTIQCSVNARFQPQTTAWNRKDSSCDSTWCQTMRHKEAMVSGKCCKCSIPWKTCFHFISSTHKKQAAKNIMPESLCFTCLMTHVVPSQTL